jgi:hypothetical protein
MILFKAAYQVVLSISKAHWKAHFWTDLQSTVIFKQWACIVKDHQQVGGDQPTHFNHVRGSILTATDGSADPSTCFSQVVFCI